MNGERINLLANSMDMWERRKWNIILDVKRSVIFSRAFDITPTSSQPDDETPLDDFSFCELSHLS